jgi:ATP-dependent Lon protease
MNDAPLQLDALDIIATEAFPGLVVRKDLLRRMRNAFGVPAFVIEFLLGKYCASTDEEVILEGLEFVRDTLSAKYVKPDEREVVKSAIKQHTTYEIIDKISVRLVETHDKYWANLANLDLDYVNIDDGLVRAHDRLLMGGIWAEIVLRYDDLYVFRGQNRPFFVESLRPIQLSTRNIDSFKEARRHFTTDQWLDLLTNEVAGVRAEQPDFFQTQQASLHSSPRAVHRAEL